MKVISTEHERQLSPRQMQLLRAIADFRKNLCYGPTLAELARTVGISRSTVFEHTGELLKKGLLSGAPGRARSLKLTCQGQKLLSTADDESAVGVGGEPGEIRLVGQVAAGAPVEAVENIEYVSLACCFGTGDDVFALEVKGDSMIDEDIRPGDYVICRRTCVAENGQLVVAVVDNESATLKRFYRQKDAVRLQPANERYQPMYSDNCRVEAVVVGLVRKL